MATVQSAVEAVGGWVEGAGDIEFPVGCWQVCGDEWEGFTEFVILFAGQVFYCLHDLACGVG